MYLMPLLLCLVLAARAGVSTAAVTSDGCGRSRSGGETVYDCAVNGSLFTTHFKYNEYARLQCKEGPLSCDVVPELLVSPNRTLQTLTLDGCSLPRLACLLAKTGASGVETLMLTDARDQLMPAHVEHLQDLKYLFMFDAGAQSSVPYEAVSTVPTLRYLILRGATVSLRPPPAAVRLDKLLLESDNILEVPTGAFRGLDNLTDLSLAINKIRNITAGALDGLQQLQALDLSRNPLRSLPPGVFSSTPRLVNVTLMTTDIRDIPTGVLTGMKHIEKIKISSRSNLTLHPRSFAELPALLYLVIWRTPLADLPSDLISGSGAIKTIEMYQCSLSKIPETLLKDQKDLEFLNLRDNRITALEAGVFLSLASLKTLDLSGNQIQVLPNHIFAGLANLLEVHLDRNALTTIEKTAFLGPQNLQQLTLSANRLTLMDNYTEGDGMLESPFSRLSKLQVLDLSRNNISEVFDDWRLSFIHSIRKIDLSWNQITVLRKTFFIASDLTVDLRHNHIRTVEMGRLGATVSTVTLLLGDNPFICNCKLFPFLEYVRTNDQPTFNLDDANCTKYGISLKEIPLTLLTCNVEGCPEDCNCALSPATSSINLDCRTVPRSYPNVTAYNTKYLKLKLETLPDQLLLPTNVITLNLTKLGLTKLPDIPKTIQELDLSHNQLSTIPQIISQMNISLFLAGNPLQCSCFYKDDIESLLEAKTNIRDASDVKCESGVAIFNIDVVHVCDVALSVVIAFISIAIAVVISAGIYYYIEEIKLFIYRRGWNMFIYEEDLDGKEFDVLISYDNAQERLVFEKFVPNLERLGYSVCVKYKHWYIGDFIPARVAETVGASRRIIVLISNTYLESVSYLELQAARLCEDKDRRRRLILVSVEDLKEDTKSFIKNFTCIAYGEQFWEKIQKYLPKRRVKKEKRVSQRGLNMMLTADGSVAFELLPKKIVDKPS